MDSWYSGRTKEKVLPWPGVLLEPMLPPIKSHSRRQIARPRPVPPCRRVVDESACWKGINSLLITSGVMPMPLSCTANRMRAALPRTTPSPSPQPGSAGRADAGVASTASATCAACCSAGGAAGLDVASTAAATFVTEGGPRGGETDLLISPRLPRLEVEDKVGDVGLPEMRLPPLPLPSPPLPPADEAAAGPSRLTEMVIPPC